LILRGLRYQEELISEAEEHVLVDALNKLPLKPFEFHRYLGNRRVISSGLRYDYARREVELAGEPPPFLDVRRIKVAHFAGRAVQDSRQVGVNE
jgi:hypothetical protein